MSWLLWRQHRQQATVTAIAVSLFAIVLWVTGVHMAHSYDAIRACAADPSCQVVDRTLLGNRGINVSRMQVGLDRARGEALQLWNVDGALDQPMLDEIRRLAHVRSAQRVEL